MRAPTRPILRYHGGKWRLAPWVIENLPPHRVYVEPFGGAASVLLRKPRSYAEVYNDLAREIVNLFRVARDHPRTLVRAAARTPFARDEYDESFAPSEDPVEQARRTLVRSFMGFGSNSLNRNIKSGFRANANRCRTTPAHDWMNFPSALRILTRRLAGVVIENRDAVEIIDQQDAAHTLFYVDPPYVEATRSKGSKTRGYEFEMTNADHETLAAALHRVDGMVVLSGYPSALYQRLYGDWQRVEREAYADRAAKRTEVLWMNEAAADALHGPSLFGRRKS